MKKIGENMWWADHNYIAGISYSYEKPRFAMIWGIILILGLNRGLRSRKRTVTSLSKDDDPSQMVESKNDNNDHDENYDEFDLLHDMKDRSIRRKRTTSESGPKYLRSLSENTPQTPLGGMVFILTYFSYNGRGN